MGSRSSNDYRRSTGVDVVKRSIARDRLMILGFMSGINECVEIGVMICRSVQGRVDQSNLVNKSNDGSTGPPTVS